MRSNIWIVMLVFIFLGSISFVSALDFDNVKAYEKNINEKYGTITITNAFGLGSKLAEYKLINNYDSVINTYAEGIVIIYSRDRLFSDIKYKDIEGKDNIINAVTYINYTENYDIQVPVYDKVCREDKENETTDCTDEIVSYTSKTNQRESWKIYTGESLVEGTYKWKIEGKKNKVNEAIDWIASAYGNDLTEWAWWNNSFPYRQKLNISGGVGTLTNFTVFINLSYTGHMQSDFDDIRFTNASCGSDTAELNYEIDYKIDNNSAGYWIMIPSLVSGNNSICVYYGNPSVTTTSNGINAWDSNYTIVMHMSENTGSYLKNSKNGNATFMALTGSPNWIDGVYGRAINLSTSGANRYARSTASTIVLTNEMSAEQWVYALGSAGVGRVHFNIISGRGTNNFGLITGQFTWGCGLFNSLWNSNKNVNDIIGAWWGGQCFGTNGVASGTNVFQNKTKFTSDTGGGSGGTLAGTEGDWALGYYQGTNNFGNAYYDEVRISNKQRTSDWLNRSYDNINASLYVFQAEETSSGLNIVLLNPIDNTISTSLQVNFTANQSASNGITLVNTTIYIINSSNSIAYNYTQLITGILNSTNWSVMLLDGIYNWSVEVRGNGNELHNSGNRTLTTTSLFPIINITYPKNIQVYHEKDTNITINWTVKKGFLNVDTCLIEYNGFNRTVPCQQNTTQYNITSITNTTVILRVNDTSNNIVLESSNWGYMIFEYPTTFNSSTYQTATETVSSNITVLSGTTISSAKLWYNGSSNTASILNSGIDNIIYNSLDVPASTGKTSFKWQVVLSNGDIFNLSTKSQTINPIVFGLCNSSLISPFINFTFKNETVSQERISSKFSASWIYYLGTGSVNKSLTTTSTLENHSYVYCLNPSNRTLYANPSTITYSNSESPQRSISTGTYTLNNITTNVTLYLLPTSLGQYVTFQIVNPADQPISGAIVNISSSSTGQLELKTTDSSGGATFFLNPLISYTVVVSASSYTSSTSTVTPTSTAYTIQLGVSSASSNTDYTKGMFSTIRPSTEDALENNTVYNFNFTLSSTFWNLDSFGYILKNANGSILSAQSSTSASGGIVNSYVSTGTNNTRMIMDYYWVVNGSNTNHTVFWDVGNNVDKEYSIKTLFTDLSTYLTSGLFGLTKVGLALIVFLSIFIITGVASYKFGITSPSAISLIVFGLVAFFDVGLGLITYTLATIPHFATAFTLLALISIFFMEGSR